MKDLIIIPAFNEAQALPTTVAGLQTLPAGFEIVLVDDGSQDRTAAVATELARRSLIPLHRINLPINGGIGVAMQTGYLFAKKRGIYRYAIQFDGDGQHDASFIPALVAEAEAKGLDLCVGSRFLATAPRDYRSTFSRRLGIRFLSRLIGALSGVWVTDPTSGFRCAGPRAWNNFAAAYPDDYPEPHSLFWCARNQLRIGEIPVRMQERQGGTSSIRLFDALYYMLKVSLAILVERLRAEDRANER